MVGNIDRLAQRLDDLEDLVMSLRLDISNNSSRIAETHSVVSRHARLIDGDDSASYSLPEIIRILKRREKMEWLILAGFITVIFAQAGALIFK